VISGENSRIKGLVLAGGKSTRMGTDKGLLTWHGKPQRYYMADMLRQVCADVFISCRNEQAAEIQTAGYAPLTDDARFAGQGPSAAIVSAFLAHPGATWLVVACDLPLLDASTLTHLLAHRDPQKIATTFESPYDGLPEPLITIWEPAAYTILLSKLQEGYKCPRKVLINNDTAIIRPPYPDALANTNTPEEAEKVRAIIQQQHHATRSVEI
jgi:molybdopterin-guanine dinucleotide biosynthesis protein A